MNITDYGTGVFVDCFNCRFSILIGHECRDHPVIPKNPAFASPEKKKPGPNGDERQGQMTPRFPVCAASKKAYCLELLSSNLRANKTIKNTTKVGDAFVGSATAPFASLKLSSGTLTTYFTTFGGELGVVGIRTTFDSSINITKVKTPLTWCPYFGSATENRTPIQRMKTACPNHQTIAPYLSVNNSRSLALFGVFGKVLGWFLGFSQKILLK